MTESTRTNFTPYQTQCLIDARLKLVEMITVFRPPTEDTKKVEKIIEQIESLMGY